MGSVNPGTLFSSDPASSAFTNIVASAYCSTNQTISTAQQCNFDTVLFDPSSTITTGSSWKFTAPVAGYYLVSGLMSLTSAIATNVSVYKNGSIFIFNIGDTAGAGTGIGGQAQYSKVVQLAQGDFIDIRTQSAATATGGSISAATTTYFDIARVA